jgi:hypothetical protein
VAGGAAARRRDVALLLRVVDGEEGEVALPRRVQELDAAARALGGALAVDRGEVERLDHGAVDRVG